MQRVLLIDDSEFIHNRVRDGFKGTGLDLLSVRNGREGIDIARALPVDLILLDINMHGMTGFEVIKELKQHRSTLNIPVVFITASNEIENVVKGLELGAVDYVIKPFVAAELRARVSASLRTKELMDLLTNEAEIDGLTGLHNRRHFDKRIKAEIDACVRDGRHVGLVLFDVDRFKSINDNHGHPMGDRVIQRIGKILRVATRNTDVACRFGGDEYVVLMPETSVKQVAHAGRRIYEAIVQDGELSTVMEDQPVTISLGGGSTSELSHPEVEALITSADQALYRAKESGRNTCCFEGMNDEIKLTAKQEAA